jgi:hypothetical protein
MTDQTNPKQLILSSVNQVLALVKSNPQIVESLPKFAPLLAAAPSETPKKSCNCSGRQNITTPDVNKQITESILSSLTTEDFSQIKNILALDKLCYYKRDVELNKLELVCV